MQIFTKGLKDLESQQEGGAGMRVPMSVWAGQRRSGRISEGRDLLEMTCHPLNIVTATSLAYRVRCRLCKGWNRHSQLKTMSFQLMFHHQAWIKWDHLNHVWTMGIYLACARNRPKSLLPFPFSPNPSVPALTYNGEKATSPKWKKASALILHQPFGKEALTPGFYTICHKVQKILNFFLGMSEAPSPQKLGLMFLSLIGEGNHVGALSSLGGWHVADCPKPRPLHLSLLWLPFRALWNLHLMYLFSLRVPWVFTSSKWEALDIVDFKTTV